MTTEPTTPVQVTCPHCGGHLVTVAVPVPPSTPADPGPILLTVPQAAEALAISQAHCWRLVSAGRLPVVRLGASVRLPREALQQWAAEHQTQWADG